VGGDGRACEGVKGREEEEGEGEGRRGDVGAMMIIGG